MATKLIIGLGNPGAEYAKTRHNVGMQCLSYVAKKLSAPESKHLPKIDAEVAEFSAPFGPAGRRTTLVLVWQTTYVNTLGRVVASLKKKYRVRPEDIIILQDDLDIPFGMTKLSFDKNSGGHRGIESVMTSLRSKKFYRIRLGIATPGLMRARRTSDNQRDIFVKKFVLGTFTPSERPKVTKMFSEALEKLLLLHA